MSKQKNRLFIVMITVLIICMTFAFSAFAEDTFDYSAERSAVDMSGNTVTVSGKIEKIVNLWPAGTSSFIAMGAGDLLTAVAINQKGVMTPWSELFYPKASSIPALGGTTPNVEAILTLDPDLVIIHPTTAGSDLHKALIDAGIPTANINFKNYEEMVKAYTFLGTILGGEWQVKLQNWCDQVNERIANVRSFTADLADADKPVVYYVAGQSDNRTQTMAGNSIINDWVTSAGGKFAMAEWTMTDDNLNTTTNRAGQTIPDATNPKEEYVLSQNIDVIMIGGINQHTLYSQITSSWTDLNAVKNNRVYTNPYACFNWDRFGLESLLQINYAFYRIQPELAAKAGINEDSIKADIKAFYQDFTDYTLTDDQVNYMFDGLTPDGTEEIPG